MIVSIPDLCTLTYFHMNLKFNGPVVLEEMFENIDYWPDFRFGIGKMHFILRPTVAYAADRSKVVICVWSLLS